MATTKSKTATSVGAGFTIARVLLRPSNRGLVLTALVVVGAIAGALYCWSRWGESAIHSADYVVSADSIAITAQPNWIHADVKSEVLQSLGGNDLELLDRDLVEKMAAAFAMHPWVAKVVRVEKRMPAQVRVDLQYRRPVLVVKMDATADGGLLFLDEHGVLLPHADFSPSQAKDFLRISAAGETPTSVYGNPWGSERIAGAARVAATCGTRWQSLGLYSIAAQRSPAGELVYELRTQDDKTRVIWGSAPGSERTGEPSAAQKVGALEQYAKTKGTLDQNGRYR